MRWTFLFLMAFSMLQAQDEVLLTRQAEAYFEAKDYDKAKELFEKLKEEKLLPWQQERLLYNLGTIEMDRGAYVSALNNYSAVHALPESAPYLSRALNSNMAILDYRQALMILGKPFLTLEEYSRIFYLLRESARHVEIARVAGCALQILEGRKRCKEEENILELKNGVKRELALIAKRYGNAKILETPVREGIPLLLSGVNQAEANLDFLERPSLKGDLKNNYLKLFSTDVESWLPLWESQVDKMEKLSHAKEQFNEGLDFLRKSKFQESRLAFLTSEASLAVLMEKLWGEDPLRAAVQKLLSAYQSALDQVPPQATTLYLLGSEQAEMRELMQSGGVPLGEITNSNEALHRSAEYARIAKREHARFYLLEAMEQIRRLLRRLTPLKEGEPEEVLENGIQDLVHALTLNHIVQGMDQETAEPLKRIQNAQAYALEMVKPFIRAVLSKEIREWPQACQCKPWKQALPLFFKGESAASEALIFLTKEKEPFLIMQKQEEAIRYWKEALERLRHPEEEKKEEEREEEPPPEEIQQKPSVQEILRLLQNMAKDDNLPKQEETAPKQGMRPW